ncbi:MAG TPA: hypothetical protein VF533_16500 [Solirubrobacteraceae bacterium]|jgi:hypothetical protein
MAAAGYDIDESAARLATYFHVLRELVHGTAGRLALEPRVEVKSALGDHLHDDARTVAKLAGRLAELGEPDPRAPGGELAALLDAADPYAVLKPRLIAAVRDHLVGLDPIADEPSLRLLTQLLHRQERHVAELPPAGAGVDPRPLPLATGGPARELRVLAPLDEPARDAYVTVGPEADPPATLPLDPEEQRRGFHALMHAALCDAELAARTSHEHPGMPLAFHADMARRCWDGIRHAEAFDQLMAAELGCRWGDHPVGFGRFRTRYARDLAGRLASPPPLAAIAPDPVAWRGSDARRALVERGQERIARVLDHLVADSAGRVQDGDRWGTHPLAS